eukprot:649682-Pelagomonas_calceolata.AAC.2
MQTGGSPPAVCCIKWVLDVCKQTLLVMKWVLDVCKQTLLVIKWVLDVRKQTLPHSHEAICAKAA